VLDYRSSSAAHQFVGIKTALHQDIYLFSTGAMTSRRRSSRPRLLVAGLAIERDAVLVRTFLDHFYRDSDGIAPTDGPAKLIILRLILFAIFA
jgi:hypothetical protein